MPISMGACVAFLSGILGWLCVSTLALASDEYVGVVTRSDAREIGQEFKFTSLDVRRPFVTFPGGNVGETTKAFESAELVVLSFVARKTGSTETFYLDKQQKRFTLIEVGALEAVVTGSEIRPAVTYGKLR